MLKIIIIINDVIEKNKIKSYLNRAKRKISNFDFELVKEFDDSRQAVNYLCQNSDIDIIIAENKTNAVFSGLDLVMLAEKEFSQSSIMLITEADTEIEFDFENINNLTAVLNKRANYTSFRNLLLLTILKQKIRIEKIRKKEEKLNDYRTIIDHTHDAIFLLAVDCDQNFYYKRINGTHQRLTALTNEEIQGKRIDEIFSKEVAEELEQNYLKCLKKKGRINYTEKLNFPAGKKIWQTSLYPVMRNGRIEEIVGASYDITDMEVKQQRLDYIKRHDKLTGLYNKEYFTKLFSEINKKKESDLSLVLINVEKFHLINQIFSPQQGDQILKEIGSILAQITDKNKIAGHLYADHFAVILKNKNKAEIEKTINYIKNKIAEINVNEIYIDTAVVSMTKLNNKKTACEFFDDCISKINLHKYKNSSESRFYQSLINYIEKNNYKDLRQTAELIDISRNAADFFELSKKEKNDFLLLAKHHDLGKLAINQNIVKKGENLSRAEWLEYQKHIIISANFAASYQDLAGIRNLIYYHHEHFDGSGWPEALKGEEIPYLSRLFAVVNFYSNLKSNLYFPFLKDKYYFGALEKQEIAKEINFYKGTVFDPLIVDKFLSFFNLEN
ncbi:MAG: HD domain-containing phosphohydrolase [Bacillota bacterium]